MKKLLCGTALVCALATVAAAQTPFVETEDNGTLASANFVAAAMYPFGGVAIDGTLAQGGDVDYYAFDLTAGDSVAVATFDFSGNGEVGDPDSLDTLLGVFAPDGTLFGVDDDDNISLLSAFQMVVPTTGRWSVAVTGFGDDDFNGTGSSEFGDYKLSFVINPVPEPATLVMLAAGSMVFLRRRG